jgi:hypothetical protein
MVNLGYVEFWGGSARDGPRGKVVETPHRGVSTGVGQAARPSRASDCIGRCPFEVDIIAKVRRADKVFEEGAGGWPLQEIPRAAGASAYGGVNH